MGSSNGPRRAASSIGGGEYQQPGIGMGSSGGVSNGSELPSTSQSAANGDGGGSCAAKRRRRLSTLARGGMKKVKAAVSRARERTQGRGAGGVPGRTDREDGGTGSER
jgi:hypothetical protein